MSSKKLWFSIAIIIGLITTTAIVSASGLSIERIEWNNPHHWGPVQRITAFAVNDGLARVSGTAILSLYIPKPRLTTLASRAKPRYVPTNYADYYPPFKFNQPYSINGFANHVPVEIFFEISPFWPKGTYKAELTGLGPDMYQQDIIVL